MKKKLLAILLSLCMVVSMLPTMVFAANATTVAFREPGKNDDTGVTYTEIYAAAGLTISGGDTSYSVTLDEATFLDWLATASDSDKEALQSSDGIYSFGFQFSNSAATSIKADYANYASDASILDVYNIFYISFYDDNTGEFKWTDDGLGLIFDIFLNDDEFNTGGTVDETISVNYSVTFGTNISFREDGIESDADTAEYASIYETAGITFEGDASGYTITMDEQAFAKWFNDEDNENDVASIKNSTATGYSVGIQFDGKNISNIYYGSTDQKASVDDYNIFYITIYTLDGALQRTSLELEFKVEFTDSTSIKIPVSYVVDEIPNIDSVETLADTTVANGTIEADLDLPETVEVTLDDESKEDVAVVWACEDYDGETAGIYTFTGTIADDTTAYAYTNDGTKTAAITVTVDSNVTIDTTVAFREKGMDPDKDENVAYDDIYSAAGITLDATADGYTLTIDESTFMAWLADTDNNADAIAILKGDDIFGSTAYYVGLQFVGDSTVIPTDIKVSESSEGDEYGIAYLAVYYSGACAATNSYTFTAEYANYGDTPVAIERVLDEIPNIDSVEDQTDFTVAYGTIEADLDLPETVVVTLDDESTEDAAVVWTCEDYDGTTAGDYTFTGTIADDTTAYAYTNDGTKTATITVTVDSNVAIETTVSFREEGMDSAKDAGFDFEAAYADAGITLVADEEENSYTVTINEYKALAWFAANTEDAAKLKDGDYYYVGLQFVGGTDVIPDVYYDTALEGDEYGIVYIAVYNGTACSGNGEYVFTAQYDNYTNTDITINRVLDAIAAPEITSIATAAGSGSVTVSWEVDANDSAIIGYALNVYKGEETIDTITDIDTGATSKTVSGLANGTEYTFSLVAVNAKGNSDAAKVTATPVASTSSGNTGSVVSSGSTSSSSSSSSSSSDDDTSSDSDGSVTVSATASTATASGTTTATVTDSNMESAIESAVTAADGEVATVEIAVDTSSSTDTVAAVLSVEAATSVADSDVAALVVTSDLGTLEISSDALAEIASQAGEGDVTIAMAYVDSSSLTDEQAAIVGDSTVIDMSISSGDSTISSFGGHEIAISLPYTLKDGEDAENIVVWHIADDGTITPMDTVYDEETGTITFTTTHFSVYAVVHDTNPFTDVVVNMYYYDAVAWAVENEITTGTSSSSFAPENPATRAQVLTFLWRAFDEPEVDTASDFTDVDSDDYYGSAISWGVEMGITSGMGDGIFGAEEDCTRAQIITFMWRAAGSPEMEGDNDFSDVDADGYYEQAVLWAVENGITNGMGDGTFGADEPCTRAQIVTFLYRYFG